MSLAAESAALQVTVQQVPVQQEEVEKNGGVTSSLLDPSVEVVQNNKRYATSEWLQFWIILKRALLFSRRDWVCITKYSC